MRVIAGSDAAPFVRGGHGAAKYTGKYTLFGDDDLFFPVNNEARLTPSQKRRSGGFGSRIRENSGGQGRLRHPEVSRLRLRIAT
jgi:hypothetical protein